MVTGEDFGEDSGIDEAPGGGGAGEDVVDLDVGLFDGEGVEFGGGAGDEPGAAEEFNGGVGGVGGGTSGGLA